MADEDKRRRRVRAQRLAPRAVHVVTAVRDACGVQAQDAAAARLSVRARCEGATAADVDAAGLVRTWAWRGTLHLLAADDVPWVLSAVGPWRASARWRQLGLDEAVYERARSIIVPALAEGPKTRAELRERLGADGDGQRLPHLAGRVAREGVLELRLDCRFAALDLPPLPPRQQALEELGRRYAAAFGPTTPRDLAKWSGVPGAPHQPGDHEPAPPSVRLLPAFDTYLLGYADRADVVAPEHEKRVFPGGGWIHPVVLVDGRAAGTWRIEHGEVAVEAFEPLPDLSAEIADVYRFLSPRSAR
jgi:hypothetical protein